MVFDVAGKEFNKLDKFYEILRTSKEAISISDAMKKAGINKNIFEYIDGLDVLSAAEMTFEQKAKLATMAIKEQAKAFISTPLGVYSAIAAGVFLIVKAYQAYKEKMQELVDNAGAAASVWQESNNILDTQIKRVGELKEALDSGLLSEQEAYNVKSELYEIQKSLIETYGEEANGLDLVNGKYEEQVKTLREMNAEKAASVINSNYTGFEYAKEQMTDSSYTNLGQVSIIPGVNDEAMNAIFEKYKEQIRIRESTDPLVYNIGVDGNVEEVNKVVERYDVDAQFY